MKSKLHLFIAILAASAASLVTQAQNVIPYLPQTENFGGTTIVNPEDFFPPSSDYTLEVEGIQGTEISIAGGVYAYTPESTGKIRFAQRNGEVYVYEADTYKGTLTPTSQTVFPDIFGDSDGSGTGIYDSRNLIQNPGFETCTQMGTGNYQDLTYWTVYDTNKESKWAQSSGNSIRKSFAWTEKEGSYIMLMHTNAVYLDQTLSAGKIKPNKAYKVKYIYRTNDSNQHNATYRVEIGSTQFGTDIFASTKYTTQNNKTTTFTFEETFQTGSNVPTDANVYFTLHRAAMGTNCIDLLDRITLVEGSSPTGLTGASNPVYLEGTAYAPVMTLKEGDSFDCTILISNPSFELGTKGEQDWTVASGSTPSAFWNASAQSPKEGNKAINNWAGTYQNFNFYQDITLPAGQYKLTAAMRTDLVVDQHIYAAAGDLTFQSPVIPGASIWSATEGGWQDMETSFTVLNDGTTVRIGAAGTGAGSGSQGYFHLDNFQLFLVDQSVAAILLTDQNSLVVSGETTAPASYVRNFSASGVHANSNNGWQTICLPFDVEEITFGERTLTPNKHFWLYKITETGFTNIGIEQIKAHTSYLISMPNDEMYVPSFNVSGDVSFKGSSILNSTVNDIAMTQYDIVADYKATHDDTFYGIQDDGANSVFLKGVNHGAFWAYAKANAGSPVSGTFDSFPIFGNETTGIRSVFSGETGNIVLLAIPGGVEIHSKTSQYIQLYNLNGQLVQKVRIPTGTVQISLPEGQYIIAGQKVIVNP